jgi:hypothetical protein
MTRIFLATPKNLRLVFPKEMTERVGDSTLHSFIAVESAMAYATTIAHGDFPIVIYSFPESEAVRILSHEEDHRALSGIGEDEASKLLDHPFAAGLLYHRRARGKAYRRAYGRMVMMERGASPSTEARR